MTHHFQTRQDRCIKSAIRAVSITVMAFTGFILVTTPAFAAPPGQPDVLEKVYQCRALTDNKARLACYDAAVSRLEQAQKTGDVVAVSKEQVQTVKKESFGFKIPSPPSLGSILGSGAESANVQTAIMDSTVAQPQKSNDFGDIKEVVLVIDRTKSFAHNKTRFYFQNGQIWEQIGSGSVHIPRTKDGENNSATITKGALGSYRLSINDSNRVIKVKRVE